METPQTEDAGGQIAETSSPEAFCHFQFFGFLESVSGSDIFQFLGNLWKKKIEKV